MTDGGMTGDERDMQKLHSRSAELQVHSLREDWQEDQDYCDLRGMEASSKEDMKNVAD